MILIMLGFPGAGKGTQSAIICEKYSIVSLATGDMLREEVACESKLGLKVKDIISSGELVSDEIISDIISNRVTKSDCKNGFILDGAVRTIKQAEMIEALLENNGLSLNAVIELSIKPKLLLERINNRINNSEEKRSDDDINILKNRIEVYNQQTAPLIPYYKNKGLLKVFDGSLPIEMVTKNIVCELESILRVLH